MRNAARMTGLFIVSIAILNAMALIMVKIGKPEIPGVFALIIAFCVIIGVVSRELHGEVLGFCIIAILNFLVATYLCRKEFR